MGFALQNKHMSLLLSEISNLQSVNWPQRNLKYSLARETSTVAVQFYYPYSVEQSQSRVINN